MSYNKNSLIKIFEAGDAKALYVAAASGQLDTLFECPGSAIGAIGPLVRPAGGGRFVSITPLGAVLACAARCRTDDSAYDAAGCVEALAAADADLSLAGTLESGRRVSGLELICSYIKAGAGGPHRKKAYAALTEAASALVLNGAPIDEGFLRAVEAEKDAGGLDDLKNAVYAASAARESRRGGDFEHAPGFDYAL